MLFILFLAIHAFIINGINSYLEFPIDYLPNENYKFLKNGEYDLNKKEKEEFMKQLFFRHLITKFEIGTPAKTQMLIINTDSEQYYLDTLTPPNNIQQQCQISEYLKFGEKEYFSEKSSESFIQGECKTKQHNYYYYDEICYSKEKIKFNINGKTEIKEFPIKIVKNHDNNVPGLIGLALNSTIAFSEKSFLSELMMENLIKDYYWFIDFDKFSAFEKKIKGKFIIGDLPHNIYPNKYPKEFYHNTRSYRDSSSWTIDINYFYIENKEEEYHLDSNHVALFYELYPIIGSKVFYNRIRELFMDKLVEEKKCFTGNFSQNIYSYDDVLFYYCDKSSKDILYENIPNINFVSKDLDYTFQLTKEELFYDKGDYIYFMIVFLPKQFNSWVLGQIFTSKYHFVFHTDYNTIGFYHKVNIEEEKNEEEKNEEGKNVINLNENNLFMIIIAIISFIVIGIVIGIIIGKKFCVKKRGKKANELVEDYDYKGDENENIN